MRNNSLLLAGIMSASLFLSGCGSRKENKVPNADRGTSYQYDMMDYLNVECFGPDGKGIIQVVPKDYTAEDFSDEKSYIAVKKYMDYLNLSYVPGEDNSASHIYIDRTQGLSNGDIVTIGVSTANNFTYDTDLSINTENYQYVVSGLTDGKDIDLFNDDSVCFYGLEGTTSVGWVKSRNTSTLPQEIQDNISYTAVLGSQGSTELREKEAIIEVTAALDQNFLMSAEPPYYNSDIYMLKHDYNYSLSEETVLDTVISPISFGEMINPQVEDALMEKFSGQTVNTYSNTYAIDRIGNIQQQNGASGLNAFTYLVTFHGAAEDGTQHAFRASMMIEDINDLILIENESGMNNSDYEVLTSPVGNGYSILAQFYSDEDNSVPVETAEAETSEGSDEEADQ